MRNIVLISEAPLPPCKFGTNTEKFPITSDPICEGKKIDRGIVTDDFNDKLHEERLLEEFYKNRTLFKTGMTMELHAAINIMAKQGVEAYDRALQTATRYAGESVQEGDDEFDIFRPKGIHIGRKTH